MDFYFFDLLSIIWSKNEKKKRGSSYKPLEYECFFLRAYLARISSRLRNFFFKSHCTVMF